MWMLSRVYGPNRAEGCRLMWDEHSGLWVWCNLPCCIGDDFNVVSLDYFLFLAKWASHFVNVSQMRLVGLCSDHFPVVLDCGLLMLCPYPLCFELMWFKVERFMDLIQNCWESYYVEGFPSYAFASKLKMLKGDLKV